LNVSFGKEAILEGDQTKFQHQWNAHAAKRLYCAPVVAEYTVGDRYELGYQREIKEEGLLSRS
jgi:hypothetical protein